MTSQRTSQCCPKYLVLDFRRPTFKVVHKKFRKIHGRGLCFSVHMTENPRSECPLDLSRSSTLFCRYSDVTLLHPSPSIRVPETSILPDGTPEPFQRSPENRNCFTFILVMEGPSYPVVSPSHYLSPWPTGDPPRDSLNQWWYFYYYKFLYLPSGLQLGFPLTLRSTSSVVVRP